MINIPDSGFLGVPCDIIRPAIPSIIDLLDDTSPDIRQVACSTLIAYASYGNIVLNRMKASLIFRLRGPLGYNLSCYSIHHQPS
jgi:hypothetical protein